MDTPFPATGSPNEGGALFTRLWTEAGLARHEQRGLYVAVSGNTGAGKSTLVKALAQRLAPSHPSVIGIDERSLHHPFLKSMFFDPTRYALGVQLNFAVQRFLMLTRWFDAGYTVIIERSHLDDELFINQHAAAGNITPEDQIAYAGIVKRLHDRIPFPDLLVCINVDADTSMKRIAQAETSGQRDREFPSDEVKWTFVSSWAERYQRFHAELRRRYEAMS
jgi:deoxyadenosine/deoxycytidine kinase